ncbi:zinc finger domain-containing protein [Leucobacter sp. M11]|uniref:zinc finger domain-containing protein n=1 Tax=Leucobacter sp. M11 TaxID=2993565 RepID=UPI003FA5AA65
MLVGQGVCLLRSVGHVLEPFCVPEGPRRGSERFIPHFLALRTKSLGLTNLPSDRDVYWLCCRTVLINDSQCVLLREWGYFAHHLNAYGKNGDECARCGSTLVRESFMNRGSHFCPTCQSREVFARARHSAE